MYKVNLEAHYIENNNQVVLVNLRNKKWIRTDKDYFLMLNKFILEYSGVDELYDVLEKENMLIQKNNISKLFKSAKDIGYYIPINSTEVKEKLNIVSLMVTDKCNLKCEHCCIGTRIGENGQLSTDELKQIILRISDAKPSVMSFTGGEPFVREDLAELLEFARHNFSGKISLLTNGTIKRKDIRRIVASIDALDISLDGFDEDSCSSVRGKGTFEKVLETIQLFKTHNFHNISVSEILNKKNNDNREKFEELCNQLNVQKIFRPVTPDGRSWENRHEFCVPIVEERDNTNPHYCKPAIRELAIFSNGDVYPCMNLCTNEYRIGNVVSDPEIIYNLTCGSEAFDNIFKTIDKSRPINMNKCKDCKVNVFCWECIARYFAISQDEELFEKYCQFKKNELHKNIWNEL